MNIFLSRKNMDDVAFIQLLSLPEDMKEKHSIVKIKSKVDRGDSIYFELEDVETINIIDHIKIDHLEKFLDFFVIDESIDEETKHILKEIVKLKDVFLTLNKGYMFDINLGKGSIAKNKDGKVVFLNIFDNFEKII